MVQNDPQPTDPRAFAPANVDDGARGEIAFFRAEAAASPVLGWLGAFVPQADVEDGFADGRLEPLLAAATVLAGMTGLGIATTPPGGRTWSHIDAMLTTPHPNVYLGVSLCDGPGERFRLGLERPADGGPLAPEVVGAAIRTTLARLRAGVTDAPALPSAPDLRPFRTEEGGRSFAQLAARAGIRVDRDASLALDALQDAANGKGRAMTQALRDGSLDPETAWERIQVGKRAWLVEAQRLVGTKALTSVLGESAVPGDPPPEAHGWAYWLRAVVAHGKGFGRAQGSYELLTAIQYLCGNRGHAAIDAAYRRLDVAALSELAMITLLRSPFTSRGLLTEWEPFRERVRAELNARSSNADAVLIGLGKPAEPVEADDMPRLA